MAEVFKARHSGAQGFERMVAVKRILPNIAADPDFVRMFIDEAKIAVQLQHPNIAQIYDLGRDGGELFIALEYIEGRDMKSVATRQKKMGRHLPLSFVVYTVVKICEALHHAHFARGSTGEPLRFIHRDISPQNILVSHEGAVKVIDFGLAKAQGRLVTTQAGVVKGKLAYLSAEQARGETIDYRSDIFSLGTCFYEWLTGERLFLRNNDADTVVAVQRAMVPPLRAVRPELPMELQVIVRRALEADPARRYQSAADMQEALMAFAVDAGMPVRRRSASKHMLLLFPEDQKGNAAVPSPRETIRSVETKLPRNAEARDLVTGVPQSLVPQATVSHRSLSGRADSPPKEHAFEDASTRAFSNVSAIEELSIVDLIDSDGAQVPFDDEVSAVPIVEHDSTALPLAPTALAQSWDDVTHSFGGGSKSSDPDGEYASSVDPRFDGVPEPARDRGQSGQSGQRGQPEPLDSGPPTARAGLRRTPARFKEGQLQETFGEPVAPPVEPPVEPPPIVAEPAAASDVRGFGSLSDETTGNLEVRAETLAMEADLGRTDFDDSTKMYSAGAVNEYLRKMESMPDAEPLNAEVTRTGSESDGILASFDDIAADDFPSSSSLERVDTEAPPMPVAEYPHFVDETAEEGGSLDDFDDITSIESLPNLDELEDEAEETTQPSIDVPSFLREDEG